MSYLIEENKPVTDQIKSVFSEQIQAAREGLRNYPEADPEGLHSARKCLKRIRSMLRLLRDDNLQYLRKRFTKDIAKIALQVSVYRDKEVLVAALERWEMTEANPDLSSDCRHLKSAVIQRQPESFIPGGTLQVILDRLSFLESRFQDTLTQQITKAHLGSGMEFGRKSLHDAYMRQKESATMETLHDLRKSAKHRLYNQELLAELFPVAENVTQSIRAFESHMGKARDCDMILETIEELKGCGEMEHDLASLMEHCEKEKQRLLDQAFSIEAFPDR